MKAIVVFLDDGLGAGATFNVAKLASLQLHSDLLKLGLLPNEVKCSWNPCQIITWLGSAFNMINLSISTGDKRIQSLETDIEYLILRTHDSFHVRRIATIAGKIISLGNCIGIVTRLMSRYLYVVINSSRSWNNHVYLNEEAISELKFWNNNVSKLNGFHFGHPNRNPPELSILLPLT